MSKNLWAALVILLVLGIGGYLAFRSYRSTQLTPPSTPSPSSVTTTPSNPPTESSPSAGETDEKVVSITADGFSPKVITINAGKVVYWMNKDSKPHNVSSAPHPQHTGYPALNLGNIINLKTASLTFPDKGTYNYHDHLYPNLTGTVVVE